MPLKLTVLCFALGVITAKIWYLPQFFVPLVFFQVMRGSRTAMPAQLDLLAMILGLVNHVYVPKGTFVPLVWYRLCVAQLVFSPSSMDCKMNLNAWFALLEKSVTKRELLINSKNVLREDSVNQEVIPQWK
jgi:hypothetical protein